MEKQPVEEFLKHHRLVFVLFPFQGHITPMLQLAAILHSKAFSITIIHPQLNSPDSSNHPDFTFIPILDNISEAEASSGDFIGFLSTIRNNCEGPLNHCIQELLKEDDRISCVIYDGLMYFAQTVADHFKLPGIGVRTSAIASNLAFGIFPPLDDRVPELQSLRLKDLAESMPENTSDAMFEWRVTLTDTMKKSSAIIVNTVEFLEQAALTKIQEYFPTTSFYAIGPFHKLSPTISSSLLKEDAYCISWLNRQAPKSVIYVSFGSMTSIEEKELVEIAWGLVNSERPFLWVLRPGLVLGSESEAMKDLPKSFKERGHLVEWAPQKEVLAHGSVGGFLSHCGWNSTLESLSEGVPMLCRPFFGEQSLNVRYVCDVWNVGLELEGDQLEKGNIEKGIRRLMVDEEGEEIRKRAMQLKEKVELSTREGGSSYNLLNDLTEKILSF